MHLVGLPDAATGIDAGAEKEAKGIGRGGLIHPRDVGQRRLHIVLVQGQEPILDPGPDLGQEEALDLAGGQVKPAVLICAGANGIAAAQRLLDAANGNLRLAMARIADT